jgi:hypothetical protein
MGFTGKNEYVGCSSCGGSVKLVEDSVSHQDQIYGKVLANDKTYKTKTLNKVVTKKHYKGLCFV